MPDAAEQQFPLNGLLDTSALFDALPESYLVLNATFEVVAANARYLTMAGRTRDDVMGKSVFDINPTLSEAQMAARRDWLAATLGDLAEGESRLSPLIRYDGHPAGNGNGERYWQARATRLDGSSAAAFVLQVTDVTDQIVKTEQTRREHAKLRSQARLRQVLVDEANAALQTHRKQLEELLAFAKVGAWELDVATGFMACTDQCKANMGLQPDDAIDEARVFEELMHVDDRDTVRAAMSEAIAGRAHFEVEYRVIWQDGTMRWLMSRGAARYLEDGSAQSLIGFTIDITARKASELHYQAVAAEEQRAREISERGARAMDHFVAAVSHELRSPLHAILWWTTLLERGTDPAHVRRAAEVIERNTRQLARMVDDLLDSGAIATGKLSVDLRLLDMASLAATVAEDLRLDAESREVTLIVAPALPCLVMADEHRLKQVVLNLLTNALKFAERGTVELAVAADGAEVVLSVRDSGVGIAPEALERIFERFEQAHREHANRAPGLGLGLWMVKNLVLLHNGSVSAHSDGLGKGSMFRVQLPLAQQAGVPLPV
ncbi:MULTISPECIES: PAS domain-containing sensor histidine kinase [unclassified Cupriavidus]|uniref:sensor histidine kinase n=1 Tax=unclassified Cupriavidus TaxID=2640874 RepID=UPI001C003CF5|nr:MULTISPECIES: PAS domain-containing sensor histidine kinase [unclassified Cupriavidus]MCA3186010.1 PAS domain-containing protein [Cupriavidus sp.]MCA3192438.1 PAS domain-containing protein [Cupriavidus sp.]MCA3198950.1 PAS domain-containing protein [Cupriavidus sp.]MCA3205312.1 PAS domain-containing protein [Cupriavidus sp.]MCA3207254.1 PAS domain-containing protein [Cupriavidus sp.]